MITSMGDPDLESLLASTDEVKQAAAAKQQAQDALRRHSTAVAQHHAERAAQVERELLARSADAGADERVLVHMAACEVALAERLGEIEVEVLVRVQLLVDAPGMALKASKMLKELVNVGGTLGARVQALLAAAATMRAQRALTTGSRTGLRAA